MPPADPLVLNPITIVVNGAPVSASNPLPVSGSGVAGSVTWATKPAAPTTGAVYFISDAGVKGSFWYYDGTRWKPLNNQALLASMDTAVAGLTNSEVVSFQYQMPAALLQLKDRLMIRTSMTKNGSTDGGNIRVRVGTAGTTGDTLLFSGQVLSATQLQGGVILEARIETATTWQPLARSDLGYGGGTTTAIVAPITMTNISSSLFVDFGAISSSTNNTVALVDVELWLIAPAN